MSDREYNQSKQPKKLMYHPARFSEWMQQTTGVINADTDFDHFFLQANLEMKYFRKVAIALERGIVGKADTKYGITKPAANFDKVAWKRMQQIWYYGLDILRQKDPTETNTLAYAPIYFPVNHLKPHQSIIHLPPLKAMNPVGQLQNPTLGIFIRALVPISLAWEGHNISTMVTSGLWYYPFSDGHKPMFKNSDDIKFNAGYTYYVSRDFFHATVDVLALEYEINQSKIFIDNHMIIESEQFGTMESEYTDPNMPLVAELD